MRRPACYGARRSFRRCGPTARRSWRGSGQRDPAYHAGLRRSRARASPGDAMMTYAAKRVGLALAVVMVVMALLFVMIYLIPGDPARVALGPRATQALIDELHSRM